MKNLFLPSLLIYGFILLTILSHNLSYELDPQNQIVSLESAHDDQFIEQFNLEEELMLSAIGFSESEIARQNYTRVLAERKRGGKRRRRYRRIRRCRRPCVKYNWRSVCLKRVTRCQYVYGSTGRRRVVPLGMRTKNLGPSDSFHYNPDRGGKGIDTYINPTTKCGFKKLLAGWKKDKCGDSKKYPYSRRGCRVAFGDISHKHRMRWNGHRTHTHGYCMDFRPMRRGRFRNMPLRYGFRSHDRSKTAEFLEYAKSFGATNIYFNDPRVRRRVPGVRKISGHDNHMHICLKPWNVKSKQRGCR